MKLIPFRSAVLLSILVLLLEVMSPLSLAAVPLRVVSVQVEGNVRVDSSSIRKALSWKAGDPWDPSLVTRDVKALYRLGAFSRVRIDEEESDEGVVVRVRVKEFPMVRSIRFKGNSSVSDSDLKKALKMKAFSFYDPADVPGEIEALKGVYKKSGYYDIAVKEEVQETKTGVRLIYNFVEGEKSLVNEIDILGNRNLTDYQITRILQTKEKGPLSWLSSAGIFVKEQVPDDLTRIRLLYFEHGYLDVVVDKPEITAHPEGSGLYIAIKVHEGPQYRVGKVKFTGEWDDLRNKEADKLRMDTGKVFVRSELLKDLKQLQNVYRNVGYARSKVDTSFKKDPDSGVIDLELRLVKGPLVRIRWIKITGNFKTRDYAIRREMRLSEGDIFSQKKVGDSRRFIRSLGFFDEVSISVVDVGEDQADLLVKVKEGSSGTFTAGFAYSSIDGLVGTLSLSQGNLLGRAQRLNLNSEFGSEKSSYSITFTEPRLFSGLYSFKLDVFDQSREFSNYTQDSKGGSIKMGYRISDSTSVSLKYRNAELTVYDLALNASSLIKQQEGTSTTSSMSLDFKYDTRDFPMDPRTGIVLMSSVEVAGGPMGGTNDFVRTVLEGSYFVPLYRDFIGSIHSKLGVINAYDDNAVPVTERFFMGGLNTIRGFEFRMVGPLDEDEEPLGGSKSFLTNFEIKYPLVKDAGIAGVLFLDVGNVWAEDENVGIGDLRKGAGFGFRWSSPVGLLRLEWGFNLDPKDDEKNPGWEFSIGTLF